MPTKIFTSCNSHAPITESLAVSATINQVRRVQGQDDHDERDHNLDCSVPEPSLTTEPLHHEADENSGKYPNDAHVPSLLNLSRQVVRSAFAARRQRGSPPARHPN